MFIINLFKNLDFGIVKDIFYGIGVILAFLLSVLKLFDWIKNNPNLIVEITNPSVYISERDFGEDIRGHLEMDFDSSFEIPIRIFNKGKEEAMLKQINLIVNIRKSG